MVHNVISIHQPSFLPWIGFFHKMDCSDSFVLLDHVQFSKNGYENRVKINTLNGLSWITVPVFKKGRSNQSIKDTEIDNSTNWRIYLLRIIKQSYRKSPYFEEYWMFFENLLSKKWKWIVDLNLSFIYLFKNLIDINVPCILSSNLTLDKEKNSEMNLKIVSLLNGSIYLSGIMGKKYLNEAVFFEKEIKIFYQDINYPCYEKNNKRLIPEISIIDFIFNFGGHEVRLYLDKLKKIFIDSCILL